MAVTRTGSVTNIKNSADSGSQSVTVPSDADFAVVTIEGFSSTTTKVSAGTVTLGGVSMTRSRSDLDDPSDGNQSGIFTLVAPATGAQTLAWNWGGSAAWNDGGQIFVAFYKGVDQTTPVKDTDGGSVISSTSAVSFTLNAASGDAIVATAYHFDNTAVYTGITKLNDSVYNGSNGSFAEGFPTGNQAITVDLLSGSGWITVSAITIAAAAAGGTTYTITLTASGSATASLPRSIGKKLAATGTSTVTLPRAISKTLSATGDALVTLPRSIAKTFTAVGTASPALVRSIAKTFSTSAAAAVTLAPIKVFTITLTATATGSVTLARMVGKTLAASGTATVTLPRRIAKTITASATGTAALTRSIATTLLAGATGTAALTRQIAKTLSTSATSIASVATEKIIVGAQTFFLTLTATGTGTASLTKRTAKTLRASAHATARLYIPVLSTMIGGGVAAVRKAASWALSKPGFYD